MRTEVPARALPLATAGLALACALGFVAVGAPWLYGFRPDAPADWPWTLWLSLFLHADLAHLAGNLLFLWPMAAALEGRVRIQAPVWAGSDPRCCFRTCECCGVRQDAGSLHDPRTCMGCAARFFGVVY